MSETEAGVVTVIDQTGRHHQFDADEWRITQFGHVDVVKDGKHDAPVATFAPGFLGVYKVAARTTEQVVRFGGGGGGGGAQ